MKNTGCSNCGCPIEVDGLCGNCHKPFTETNVKKTGFTLIELLVLLAIIGILVAMLVPAIKLGRKRVAAINAEKARTNMVVVDFTNVPGVGDRVSIEGINAVGIVNGRSPNGGFDILTTNGMLQGVNFSLVKKLTPQAEKE